MKILLLKDKTINNTLLGQVQLQLRNVYADLGISFLFQDFDYTSYPIEPYWGGYFGIKKSWLKERCAEVYKKYSEEVDMVVFLVASDNWVLDDKTKVTNGVWGWNISAQYSGYGVQQCRFAQVKTHTDERNVNNSAGTLYHEIMHDHDTYVFVNTGELLEKTMSVGDWDDACVHGEHPDWAYIRTTKDNLQAVKAIMPLLIKARNTRLIVFLKKKIGMLQQIQVLMMKVRALQAAARGDIAMLPDNKCKYVK